MLVRCAIFAVAAALLAGCEKALEEPVVEEAAAPAPAPEPAVPEGVEALNGPVKITMPDPEEAAGFVHDSRSQVSILLYHDVSTSDSSNPMKINISKFRKQMETLKENEIPVISMSDFMKWKRGEINIPEFSVVITFDDGWREVYTMAFPVMKELDYPFTLFLYTKYLNIGGRSLTFGQIEEMIRSGAEVGSHSISHLDMTSRRGLSQSGYEEFLVRELTESRAKLKKDFGEHFLEAFSFPFGTYSDQIIDQAFKAGYETLLTVDGKKSSFDTPNGKVGRYIIHGNNDSNYGYALTYKGNAGLAGGGKNLLVPEKGQKESLVVTRPADDATISERLPLVEVDLSKLDGIDPASVTMRIGGIGKVPARYDPVGRTLRYQMRQRLRGEDCSVTVSLKRAGEESQDVIAWRFFLDRKVHYLGSDQGAGKPAVAAP